MHRRHLIAPSVEGTAIGAVVRMLGVVEMKGRRIVACAGAALMLVGGASIVAAPVASAADLSPGCQDANRDFVDGFYANTGARNFFAGETLSVRASTPIDGGTTGFKLRTLVGPVFEQSAALGETITFTFTVDEPDTIMNWATIGIGNATWLVSCTNGDAPPAPDPAAPSFEPSPIPQWEQAYGIFHHDDACATGWSNSWQSWAEPITGGWVCTRSIPSLG